MSAICPAVPTSPARRPARWRGLFAVLTLSAATLLAAPAAHAAGGGDLLVAPTRVILNGAAGTEVILNNIGSEPATYRISLELRRMRPDGSLDDVTPEEANQIETAALEMVRFAPRRVLLPPDQPQSVRISARPAAELPDGEYRVHMLFRAIPEANAVVDQAVDVPQQGFVIRLTPIYGVTIPVIVRKGQLAATAAISNPHIARQASGVAELRFELARNGDRSLFGEVHVIVPGRAEPLFIARGISVYTEVNQREVAIAIPAQEAAALRGPIRLEYREPAEQGGRLIAAVETNAAG